ncbi:putative serine O-acetyltransferase [Helianthus anomalus]
MAVIEFIILLYGYHSLQTRRVAHALWNQGCKVLALALQSRVSEGILLDHRIGLVIGETVVIGDRVSQIQGVTLGGIGNIKIGEGARIASGSLVLKDAQVMRTRMVDLEARVEEERNILASRLEEEKNLLATRLDEERKQWKNFKNNFKNLR